MLGQGGATTRPSGTYRPPSVFVTGACVNQKLNKRVPCIQRAKKRRGAASKRRIPVAVWSMDHELHPVRSRTIRTNDALQPRFIGNILRQSVSQREQSRSVACPRTLAHNTNNPIHLLGFVMKAARGVPAHEGNLLVQTVAFSVPLVHNRCVPEWAAPHIEELKRESLQMFARIVRTNDEAGVSKPLLLYLQGGPGFQSYAYPLSRWVYEATSAYQVRAAAVGRPTRLTYPSGAARPPRPARHRLFVRNLRRGSSCAPCGRHRGWRQRSRG